MGDDHHGGARQPSPAALAAARWLALGCRTTAPGGAKNGRMAVPWSVSIQQSLELRFGRLDADKRLTDTLPVAVLLGAAILPAVFGGLRLREDSVALSTSKHFPARGSQERHSYT